MYRVGDEKTVDNKTYVYTGYGVWEELPTSTSQETKQDTLLTELQLKADLTETQPVSAATLPLPAGASTSLIQTDGTQKSQSVHSDGTLGQLISGVQYVSGKSGVDASTNTLQTIAYEHHEIHSGSTFCVHLADNIVAKNTEMGVLFTTPAGTKWLHLVYQVSMADKAIFDILEAPTIDTGNYPTTFYTPINRNRNSLTESIVSSVRAAPVVNQVSLILDGNTSPISADGTLIHTEIIGGAKNKSATDGHSHADEYILKANTTYYFRVVGDNTGAGNLQFSMELIWYEHTDKTINATTTTTTTV